MLKIESVEPGSYAAEIGLDAGDQLISINGHEINDLIDYHLHVEPQQLVLEVLRRMMRSGNLILKVARRGCRDRGRTPAAAPMR